MTYVSKEARDGAVSTGMTDGMEYSYARLDDMLLEPPVRRDVRTRCSDAIS